jgi:hypothetical protein
MRVRAALHRGGLPGRSAERNRDSIFNESATAHNLFGLVETEVLITLFANQRRD